MDTSHRTFYHVELDNVATQLLEVNVLLKDATHKSREDLFVLRRRKKRLDKQYNELSEKIKALNK